MNVPCLVFAVVAALLIPSAVSADWINTTGAERSSTILEVHIEPGKARLLLELGPADAPEMADAFPDSFFTAAGRAAPPIPEATRHERFFGEVFRIVAGEVTSGNGERAVVGESLPGRVVTADVRPRIVRPLAPMTIPRGAPRSTEIVYLELEYDLPEGVESIVIAPPTSAQNLTVINIGFIAFHQGLPIVDFRFLSTEETLRLDWDDPWSSRFDNPNLVRHHRSPLMAYLYVDPFEVRQEVLVRARDAARLAGVPFDHTVPLQPDALRSLRESVTTYFRDHAQMTIDGREANPVSTRTDLVAVGLTGVTFLPDDQPVDPNGAIFGLIFTYPVEGYPETASMTWTVFDDVVDEVPASTVDAVVTMRDSLRPGNSELVWHKPIRGLPLPDVEAVAVDLEATQVSVPLVSAAAGLLGFVLLLLSLRLRERRQMLFGAAATLLVVAYFARYEAVAQIDDPRELAPRPADEDATAIVDAVLTNVYKAFEAPEEGAVYDRLAVSASGDLLERIYLESRQSLAVEAAGGAAARVRDVEVDNLENLAFDETGSGFTGLATWTIRGTVGHWGHTHIRQNRYVAEIAIDAVGDTWKLGRFDVVNLERTR